MERSMPHSQALLDYVKAHAQPEDAFLTDLREASRAAGIPQISISPAQGRFMQLLLRLQRAEQVVEVGTLGGYSALSMALVLPSGGKVRTIEIDGRHAAFARDWVGRSAHPNRVEVFEGSGLDLLPTFAENSADVAFLDADKVNYGAYLEECLRIVKPGGLILVDNAFAFGNLLNDEEQGESVAAIRSFNEQLHADHRLDGVIVPLGDGLWVCVVR
jgi:predicted O-methyltransferase YrrM